MSLDAWAEERTAATFKAIFPEFSGCPDALVTARIAMAEQRTPAGVWGVHEDQGVLWLTAHMLALLPGSKDMRLGEPAGETMYGRERKFLERIVSSGFRVAGLPPTCR